MTRRQFVQATAAGILWRASSGAAPPAGAETQRTPVVSTNLATVGYDRSTATLEIEFRGGALYRYRGVPHAIYRELMSANSKGRYFVQHIRGKFAALLNLFPANAPVPSIGSRENGHFCGWPVEPLMPYQQSI